jgi:hypothetical protein
MSTVIDNLSRPSYMRLREQGPQSSKVLADIGFQGEWGDQLSYYNELWRWYDGQVWYENSGKFALGYNPLRLSCMLHRNVLFGEVDDTSEPLVRPRFLVDHDEEEEGSDIGVDGPEPGKLAPETDARLKHERKVSRFLNNVWYQSNGRAIQSDNGLVAQILGGCVFGAYARFDNPFLRIPFQVEAIAPGEFMPVYSPSDPWHLLEAYIIRWISAPVAKHYYNVDIGKSIQAVYVERWTRSEYEITINDQTAYQRGATGWLPLKGKNKIGVVPFVYIPHEREGNEFYGTPVLHQQEGLLEEMNARLSDLGVSVKDGANPTYIARNISQRGVGTVKLTEYIDAVDIGSAGIGGEDPDVFPLDPPKLPEGAYKFPHELQSYFRRGVFTPDVAYGEDEGSQRSGMTLEVRMWPMTSHARQERINWTMGLNVMNEILIRMAVAYADHPEVAKYGITEADFNQRMRQDWAPMLPRDVETQQTLTVAKHGAGIISTQTAVEQDDTIEDSAEELRRIQGEQAIKQEQAMQEMEAQAKIAAENAPPKPAPKSKSS